MTTVFCSPGSSRFWHLTAAAITATAIIGCLFTGSLVAQVESPAREDEPPVSTRLAKAKKDYYYVIPKSSFGLTEFRMNYYPVRGIAPYALLDGIENVWVCPKTSDRYFFDFDIAIQSSEPIEKIEGTLFLPDQSKSELKEHKVAVILEDAVSEKKFLHALESHYQYLIRGNFTGRIWFQHRLDQIRGKIGDGTTGRNINRRFNTLDRTFDMFSGARAIAENIQLDRGLRNANLGDPVVDVDTIKGITIKEFDWDPHLDEKLPVLDPLAKYIPHDQHVVFSNSLQNIMAVLTEVSSIVTPSLSVFTAESVDRQVVQRYFRQMALDIPEIAKQEFAQNITGLAVTGSDPYSELGTDIGVIIQMRDEKSAQSFADYYVKKIGSDDSIDGFTHSGWNQTPDRSLSAFCFQKGSLFVCANSEFQLRRIQSVIDGEFKPLVHLKEYRFFRQRYVRSAEESAFVFMSDAAIRRWCSAKWRITQSRRLRALAMMQRMQAEQMKTCLNIDENKTVKPHRLDLRSSFLGEISMTRAGIQTSRYGSMHFVTPIAELNVQKVSEQEKSAYERWRDSYQRNWSQAFDPIGIQFKIKPSKMEIDLSVIPLIMSTSYRWLTDGKPMQAFSGDLHPETLIHLVAAPGLEEGLKQFLKGLHFVELYADEDRSFWRDFTDEKKAEEHFRKNIQRLPVALVFHFDNRANMLKALETRRFIESALVKDTELKYKGQTYRRMEFEEHFINPGGDKNLVLYGFKEEKKICFSLSEKLIQRVIDRKVGEKKPDGNRPWLGKSLAVQLDQRFFRALEGLTAETYRKTLREQSWKNLPILNEWKREFSESDARQIHLKYWGEKLICAGGGTYKWDSRAGSYISTAFGSPARPKIPMGTPFPLRQIKTIDGGLSFETGGIRAKLMLEKK